MKINLKGTQKPFIPRYPTPPISGQFDSQKLFAKEGVKLKSVPGKWRKANSNGAVAVKLLEAANSFVGHTFIGAEKGNGTNDFLYRYETAVRYLNIIYGSEQIRGKFEEFVKTARHGFTYATRLSPLVAIAANIFLGRSLFDRKIVEKVDGLKTYLGYPNQTIKEDIFFGEPAEREIKAGRPNPEISVPIPEIDEKTIKVLDIGCAFNGAAGSPTLQFAKKALGKGFEFYGIDLMPAEMTFPMFEEEKKEWVFVDNYKFSKEGISQNHPDGIVYLNTQVNPKFDIGSEEFDFSKFGKFHLIFCNMLMPSLVLADLQKEGLVKRSVTSIFHQIGKEGWENLTGRIEEKVNMYLKKIKALLSPGGILFFCPTSGIKERDDYHELYIKSQKEPIYHFPFSVDFSSWDFRWWLFKGCLNIKSNEKKGKFLSAMTRLLRKPYSKERALWARMVEIINPEWRNQASVDERIAYLERN